MLQLILIGLSFIFGLLSVRHLRKFDIHEKEPFIKMAAVTVWGGLVSVIISLFLYGVLTGCGINIQDGIPFSYFYVGFVEEAGKLVALFLCWPIIHKELNEPTDGPIYIACVALGFSLIENYFYAQATPMTSPLIAIRLIICTPMHIAFSMIMGLAFFWAVRFRGGWGVLLGAYIFAGIYHALYNIFVTYWFLLPGIYFILKWAYRWMCRLLGYTAAQSPFRQTLSEFIHSMPAPEIEQGLECLDCGNMAPKPTYKKGRIRVQRCEECGAYLSTAKNLNEILRHFGSAFGRPRKKKKSGKRQKIATPLPGCRLHRRKKIGCFDLAAFTDSLEKQNREVITCTERKWWCVWKAVQD